MAAFIIPHGRFPFADDIPPADLPFKTRWPGAVSVLHTWRQLHGQLLELMNKIHLTDREQVNALWSMAWLNTVFCQDARVDDLDDFHVLIKAARYADKVIRDASELNSRLFTTEGHDNVQEFLSLAYPLIESSDPPAGAIERFESIFEWRDEGYGLNPWKDWRHCRIDGNALYAATAWEHGFREAVLNTCWEKALELGATSVPERCDTRIYGFYDTALDSLHMWLNGIKQHAAVHHVTPSQGSQFSIHKPDQPSKGGIDHAADFSWISSAHGMHTFTPTQRPIVKALWEDRERGGAGLSQNYLLTLADCETKALKDLFKRNPAFGTLIVRSQQKRGIYCLSISVPKPD